MRDQAAAVAACAVLFLTACTAQSPESDPEADGRTASVELRCEESDAVEPPPDGQRLTDSVVVARAHAPERSGRPDGLLFAKSGLWLRSPAAVRLVVVGPASALAGWGKPGRPARELALPSCAGTRWRVWPGGFYVAQRACVRLLVETERGSDDAAVPVGAACA